MRPSNSCCALNLRACKCAATSAARTPTDLHLPACLGAPVLQEVMVADPSRWDTNPAAMWQGASSYGSQGKRRVAGGPDVTTVDNNLQALVQHAANNIAHKDQLAVFVPSMIIIQLAQHHQLLGLSDMEVVLQQHVARIETRKLLHCKQQWQVPLVDSVARSSSVQLPAEQQQN